MQVESPHGQQRNNRSCWSNMLCCFPSCCPCWERSEPNEWMIVMEDGNCVRSGIGITHWKTANQSVARFPSALEEVKFNCDQVTKEMTGIKVKGFAIWSINREGDGPFKAFRSLRGLTPEGLEHANRSIGQMVES